ncbi:DUF805 domain-containing protein [Kocuria rhizophila]|uniref:Hypothetical membrane protein n=1 Tax=Kocuria rhizophila (strain ATCC 9341 / DSM 348 / NBRC 103217 / DC2201) TaxID=378753 RepID=B2GK79_KOCRD|nr:DUF805 domain-containing protein [Kocuria rhizophila]BAG28478.1 hypothetical membrane protein [Kocuria rhizophila DC2201]VEH76229.1 Inner membrane protein yhaH [Kocuria rhizophila]
MTMPYQPAARGTQPGEPVGPIKAIGNYFRKGFQFSGRASRSEYWWIALYSFLFAGALEFAQAQNENWLENTGVFGSALGIVVALIILVVGLLLTIFTIALNVRRLHDCNLSGWLYLLILVPFLGSIALLIMAALPPDPRGVRFDAQPAAGTVMPAGR